MIERRRYMVKACASPSAINVDGTTLMASLMTEVIVVLILNAGQ